MRIALILISLVVVVSGFNGSFPTNDGPAINPMKGWSSGWGNNLSYSSLGFQYVSWKDFEAQNDNYNFTFVENTINRPGSKGRHVILRLYGDWSGSDTTSRASPSWLFSNVTYLSDGKGHYATDYNDADFLTQAVQLINKFGQKYNSDPRIYAIQLGVLGCFGEWHAAGLENYTILDSTKNQILAAYRSSFPDKLLMARHPWDPLFSTPIGFHNDFFVPNNKHSDYFDTSVSSGLKWMTGTIGGATPPQFYDQNSTSKILNYNAMFNSPTGENMIKKAHYSFMKMDDVCNDADGGPYCQGFKRLHRMMGYNYQLTQGEFADSFNDTLKVSVKIKNIGVAPMYYNWFVELALLNNSQTVKVHQLNVALKSLYPGNNQTLLTTFQGLSTLANGDYQLGIRISQPGANSPKTAPWGLNARNVYVEFANSLTVLTASWNSNNALVGGWTILGTVKKLI